ncbi:MAG: hypothetical protein ACRDHY_00305 [Anaerolineales bacterium]
MPPPRLVRVAGGKVRVIEQIYEFTPPGGDPERPIKVLGLQDYAPQRRPRQVAVWEFTVPECYRAEIPDGFECRTYAEVRETLTRCFLEGDATRMADHMVEWYADYLGPRVPA